MFLALGRLQIEKSPDMTFNLGLGLGQEVRTYGNFTAFSLGIHFNVMVCPSFA